MSHDKELVERFRSALREYRIARTNFEFCETDFIDSAIDRLSCTEKALEEILKELRDEMGTKVSNNQE